MFADEMAELPSIHMVYVFDRLAEAQRKNLGKQKQTVMLKEEGLLIQYRPKRLYRTGNI